MRLSKRTYSLPPDLVKKFEAYFAPGERSRFLAKLIEQWLEERQREEMRRGSIEGCKEMGDVYEDVDREWNGATDEVWRDAG